MACRSSYRKKINRAALLVLATWSLRAKNRVYWMTIQHEFNAWKHSWQASWIEYITLYQLNEHSTEYKSVNHQNQFLFLSPQHYVCLLTIPWRDFQPGAGQRVSQHLWWQGHHGPCRRCKALVQSLRLSLRSFRFTRPIFCLRRQSFYKNFGATE